MADVTGTINSGAGHISIKAASAFEYIRIYEDLKKRFGAWKYQNVSPSLTFNGVSGIGNSSPTPASVLEFEDEPQTGEANGGG